MTKEPTDENYIDEIKQVIQKFRDKKVKTLNLVCTSDDDKGGTDVKVLRYSEKADARTLMRPYFILKEEIECLEVRLKLLNNGGVGEIKEAFVNKLKEMIEKMT